MFRSRLFLSLALLGTLLPSFAAAQKPGTKPGQKPPVAKELNPKEAGQKEPQKPSKENIKEQPVKDPLAQKEAFKGKLLAITPEREAAVISFVERNHAELAALLAHLKANQPKEYERAVRDLFRVTEKLAMVHERDSRQYDLELKAWKSQSRAQLLVARLKMTDPESANSEELKNQLREILSEQMQARLEVMKLERERVSGRLEKLNDDITRMERDRESVIDNHVTNLMNQVNANRPKPKPTDKRPADKIPPEKKPQPTT